MTADQFRNRPMTVTTKTRCDECNALRDDPDVKLREFSAGIWARPQYSVRLTSCGACFEAEKIRARAEAEEKLPAVIC